MGDAAGGAPGGLRMDRGVLQPAAAALGPGVPEPGGVRGDPPRGGGRLITMCLRNRPSPILLGREFTALANLLGSPLQLTEEQAQCLRNFIIKDPFITPTIFGIYTMVDVVFTLSRNGYPIPRELALTFFRETCGKIFEWASPTTARHGMRMYSNYAAELGLLGTVGRNLYLTPDGLRFILLLQLHKSIKMIDVLNL